MLQIFYCEAADEMEMVSQAKDTSSLSFLSILVVVMALVGALVFEAATQPHLR